MELTLESAGVIPDADELDLQLLVKGERFAILARDSQTYIQCHVVYDPEDLERPDGLFPRPSPRERHEPLRFPALNGLRRFRRKSLKKIRQRECDRVPDEYRLEYQDGSLDRHYEAIDDPITFDQVFRAFCSYLRGDDAWRTAFRWKKLELPDAPFSSQADDLTLRTLPAHSGEPKAPGPDGEAGQPGDSGEDQPEEP